MYTTESHELALCIINDGDGSQCGFSYNERCRFGERFTALTGVSCTNAGLSVDMAKRAARWYVREFGAPDDMGKIFTARDILLAALEVADYYAEHVKELA